MKYKIAALMLVAGSVAYAQSGRPTGYLAPGEFDAMSIVGPAPQVGDPRYETDRAIFRETRKLVGTPRYELATNDAKIPAPAMLADFSCSVGVQLTPENAPMLTAVAQRAAMDAGAQAGRGKELYKRERPYLIDAGATTCQAPEELIDRASGRASYDYPSGHSTWGFTWALVLAAAVPDRAQQILERGRAYAESRFVCGVHNKSAVEAGILTAATTMAVIQSKPAYQADLEEARAELAALRNSGSAPQNCEFEQSLVAQRVLPPFPAPQ